MVSSFEKQRDILYNAMKKIATSKNCPDWIEKIIRQAVQEARNIETKKEEFPALSKANEPLNIDDMVETTAKDECVYKIIEEVDPIEGVRLFNIRVETGDINNMVGQVYHNVPETMLRRSV